MKTWESECDTERAKTVARWFFIGIVAAMLQWQRARGVVTMPVGVYLGMVGAVVALNLLHSIYLFRVATCPLLYKYLTVATDALFVTAVIAWSGYARSPYFYLYFVLLISNCMRYGMVMSIYLAALVNVLYAGVLSAAPPADRTAAVLGGEGLKLLAFWGVALYGGGVASRIQRHLHEMDAYQETIEDLKARLAREHEAAPAPAAEEGGADG